MGEQDAQGSHRVDVWDQFLESSRPDIGFMQSSWWAAFLVTRGWGHFGTVFKDGEEILGGARVMTYAFAPGKCFYYIPEGPVLPEDDADAEQLFQAVMEFINKKRRQDPRVVSHLRLEPRWAERPSFVHGCREAKSWIEPRHTLHIDLSLSETVILAQMKAKGRYNIGVARRHGVSVVEDRSPQGIGDFLELYDETFSRHSLHGKRTEYFQTLMAALAADHGSLFFAEYQGIRLATALVVYFGDRATYFYGGSRAAHRHVMAPYLLHCEVILKAKALGYRWYDFYGIAPQNQPDHRWANFSAFKRKFGGVELSFVPALDSIYDPSSYQEYRQRKSRRRSGPGERELHGSSGS
jgi:lipid II:glycine glycyltransferase (peptidoglycan interpeptide bridge formation enzyme)